jgi:hypothetical protein
VGLALAIPRVPFSKPPCTPRPGLQSTCVRSCLETRDRRYLRRSLAKIFSAACCGVRNAKRVAYLLWSGGDSADAGMPYAISSNQPRVALLSQQNRLLESKNEVAKATNLVKPLLCLRSCLRSSRAFRPEPRGEFRRQYDQEVPKRTSIRHAVRRHRGVPLSAPYPPIGRPSAGGGAPLGCLNAAELATGSAGPV